MNSRFFFIEGLRQFGNIWEALDYQARRCSSTIAISGSHASHIWITNLRCALFLAHCAIFCLLAPTSGLAKRKDLNSSCQMVLQIGFLSGAAILQGTATIDSTNFCAIFFFVAFPHAARGKYLFISSCTICCIPSYSFVQHIVLFSAFLRAPNRALNCATATSHGTDTHYVYIYIYMCIVCNVCTYEGR